MNGGYLGKLLFVDLTRGKIETQDLNENLAKNFIGGYGIGARVLYNLMKPGVDPLGPDNVLGFVTGPLTGTGALFGGRYAVVCKSPVNGGWNDANSGGFWGPELKKAGFDGVFVSGTSPKPVYLWIKDGHADIRDARNLWGKDCSETQDALIEEIGEKQLRAAVIGPAGEKRSLMASIINDRHRAAARGGVGAVMGSKNLKAIAVRGKGKVPVADMKRLIEVNKIIANALKDGPMSPMATAFGTVGTGMANTFSVEMGDMPVKNWAGASMVDFRPDKLEIWALDSRFKTKQYNCSFCPLGCGADYKVDEGEWPIGETYRPEYETWAGFGGLCGNDNAEAIIKCNDICNRYGIDTISTSGTVAWAIECYEKGLFSKVETGGIELTWGNSKSIVAITQAIANQTGLGRILAMGSAAAAKTLGKGSEYLITVRGMELPMHDPKCAPGYGRTYQFDPTSARHVKGGLGPKNLGDPKDKYNYDDTGQIDKIVTCMSEFLDTAGLCQFILFTGLPDAPLDLIEAATGWTFTQQDRLSASMRTLNMRQTFNLREGIKPKDSVLPARVIGEPPLQGGPTAGITIDNRALARNFFKAMEWDEDTGKPSRESLERLGGMDDVIRDLFG